MKNMFKGKRKHLFLITILLLIFALALFVFFGKGSRAAETRPEKEFQDENVDKDGWT